MPSALCLVPNMKCLIITLSDRASRGEYEDRSGPEIEKHMLGKFPEAQIERVLLGDEPDQLKAQVERSNDFDVVITTGGTGVGPRDITPDVVKPMLDREIPGIMEYIRIKHAEAISCSVLSRGVAGIRGSTLVYTLPGSVKAARDYMEEILRSMGQALRLISTNTCDSN